MGLDMYLEGRTFNWSHGANGAERPKRDGFEVKRIILELAYWRKHPNLHGYIVKNFAEGKDDCQDIFLSPENIEDTIRAAVEGRLPKTEGFFFGSSEGYPTKETIDPFKKALAWVNDKEAKKQLNETRDVVYRASW